MGMRKGNNMIKWIGNGISNFICFLIYKLEWNWVDAIISSLCTLEMNLKLSMDKELHTEIITCIMGDKDNTPSYLDNIPKDTLYCVDCPYRSHSKLAKFFYGPQSSGYCYFINKGDFSFGRCTDLLWDGCKECGVNEDITGPDIDNE